MLTSVTCNSIYTELSIHPCTQVVCRQRGHLLDPSQTSQSGPRSLHISLEHTQHRVLWYGQGEGVEDKLKTDNKISHCIHVDICFNPLTPMSDQERISPYNIHTISSRQVMRIKKYQLGDYSLIQYQILQTNITKTVYKMVRGITNEILGAKGLKNGLKGI